MYYKNKILYYMVVNISISGLLGEPGIALAGLGRLWTKINAHATEASPSKNMRPNFYNRIWPKPDSAQHLIDSNLNVY